jgi:RNA polymerase subunit RPABC4/transcription elongation factor Spt4
MDTRHCERCGQLIYGESNLCSTCGAGTTESRPATATAGGFCVNCGESLGELSEGSCPKCGHPIGAARVVPASSAAAPATSARRWSGGVICVGACAVISIIAAFLPWEAVGPFSIAGTRGDGVLTLGAGVIGLAVLLAAGKRRAFYIVETLLGAFVVLIGAVHLNDATASTGIYLTFLAGIVWALTSLVAGLRK